MALKTPVRVFRKTFPAGATKTIDFAEAGFSTPLDSTHLILAFIFVANTTVATFPGTWTSIFGGSTGSGPTQIRLIATQGDGSTNSLTIGTASAVGSITLVAYPDFVSLTPITAASSVNVTTATSTYNLPDFGAGTANGVLFDMIGGPSTFAGATYNRGTLVGDLDASGQMILAQEYTDGSADQSVTVTMPSSRVGRYSQVVMPIGVGGGGGTAGTIVTTATDAAADGGTATLVTTANGTMTANAGAASAGVSDGWPETWPDAFGPVPAYMTGAALATVAVGEATADGGSATLAGLASAALVAVPTDASADGGSATLAGANSATLTAFTGDSAGTGGDATLTGQATAALLGVVAEASADGGDAMLAGLSAATLATIAGDGTGDAGSAALIGGAASTLTVISGESGGAGGDATLSGGAVAGMTAIVGTVTVDGGAAAFTGVAVLIAAPAGDAAATGGTADFLGAASSSMTVVSSDAVGDGGSALIVGTVAAVLVIASADVAAAGGLALLTTPSALVVAVGSTTAAGGAAGFNGEAIVIIVGSHTFVIRPWAGGAGHDVNLHKRRAYAEITGRPLSRGRADGMVGPDVELSGDDTARVTYTLTR